MDYVALILFLALYYIRPQEWASAFNMLRPVQLLSVLALYAIIQRPKPVRIQDLWSTPIDYVVSAYFAWTVFASPAPGDTFRAILPVIFFYFVGVLTLNTLTRLKRFLAYWAFFIVFISALALLSTVGFDPLNSQYITMGAMKGRLALNLSIFNNPNSLAHAIVPVFPMLYYLLFWRKVFMKALIVVVVIPATCILLTLSKGAFLSSAITIFATLMFGRPKKVQIALLVLAGLFGGTAIYALPRMAELRKSRTDPAIQGRVAAFKFGLETMERNRYGHGLGNFVSNFQRHGPVQKVKHKRMSRRNGVAVLEVYYRYEHYTKASHSAYVQNGADLGYVGFFLFIGILYCCLRTLITAKTATNEEEMLRRTLFAVVVAYTVSSWMVDFCYRPTFFLFAAATSAFHRHLRILTWDQRKEEEEAAEEEAEAAEKPAPIGWPGWQPPLPQPAGMPASAMAMLSTPEVAPVAPAPSSSPNSSPAPRPATGWALPAGDQEEEAAPEPEDTGPRGNITWAHLTIWDGVFIFLSMEVAIRIWKHAIHNM